MTNEHRTFTLEVADNGRIYQWGRVTLAQFQEIVRASGGPADFDPLDPGALRLMPKLSPETCFAVMQRPAILRETWDDCGATIDSPSSVVHARVSVDGRDRTGSP